MPQDCFAIAGRQAQLANNLLESLLASEIRRQADTARRSRDRQCCCVIGGESARGPARFVDLLRVRLAVLWAQTSRPGEFLYG